MKSFLKLVYFGSLTFIILLLLVQILLKITQLEFSEEKYQENFDSIFFFGIPIAIELTLARLGLKTNLSRHQTKSIIIRTTFIAVACFLLFIFYFFTTFGSSMCTWVTGETLYKNTSKKSQRVVKRYFGCGATDSSPATVAISKLQDITPLFVYVTDVDTNKLDKTVWVRLKSE